MSEASYTPVAGCAPLADARAAAYHQRWLVGDDHGRWLAPFACPALRDVEVTLRLGYLVLRAPGMLRLDIPLDVLEDDDSVCGVVQVGDRDIAVVDEGDLAAAWFSQCLGRSCRLYKVHPDASVSIDF